MAIFISIILCFLIVGLLLPDKIKKKGKKISWIVWGGLAILVLLLASGKLNLLTALTGLVLAILTKLPQALKMWGLWNRVKQTQQGQNQNRQHQQQRRPMRTSDMSRGQALKILGLTDGASRKEITMAYKRLMQKLHPDRGGSEVLAAEVNRARDVLLK